MPKLLIISITCNQGSTGKISEQVGLMMQNRGWDVYYAHGQRRVNPSQLKTIPFSSVRGEYLHALKSLLLDADGLGSTKATERLVEQIKKIKPDIIQLHNLHGYYLNYEVLFNYLNSTNIPVVMTLHDCWSFTGHCVHFVTAGCEKWKTGCSHCPISNAAPKKSLIDRSARNYKLKKELIATCKNLHIVPVSKWLGGLVRQSMFKNLPIQVIQNGIDLSMFKPLPKQEGKFQIMGIANPWSKDKGLYDVYELRKMLPASEYDITLVGLSEKQLKALPEGISGIMRTSNQQELADLYAKSNVVINPTYADTFPTINLEALACGTPVITYRTGGSPEAIDEKTGMVVEQGNVNELVAAILKMKESPLSSSDCRKRAEEYFDKDKCFEKYIKLYDEILK